MSRLVDLSRRTPSSPSPGEIKQQWVDPSDIFSVLLILGGDVIQLACAAMASGTVFPPNPVAFSFGWVAYAVSAVLSAIGESRLISCPPEVAVKVINLKSRYCRQNNSWLLSRLMKTYHSWMSDEVRTHCGDSSEFSPPLPGLRTSNDDPEQLAETKHLSVSFTTRVGLCVAIYKWRDDYKPRNPIRDFLWWSGYAVSLVQLGIAAIPFGLHNDWAIFFATAAGTVLAYISASLPQWHHEKWHCRDRNKDVALTLGNGTKAVIIIQGSDNGLDLEDLASGEVTELKMTQLQVGGLCVLWIILLITCTGIQNHTWYLLAVGAIGMLHNIIVAAAPRTPEAMGLPIEPMPLDSSGGVERFAQIKVMWTLMELELKYPGHGRALRNEFFPGDLLPWEEEWWNLGMGENKMQIKELNSKRLEVLNKKRIKWLRRQEEKMEAKGERNCLPASDSDR